MKKSDLVKALSGQMGFSLSKADEIVSTVFNAMSNALANGERVEIRGFGSFKVKHYDGYQGRNPKTGQIVNVKPKKMPFFKCGKELNQRVNNWK